MKNIVRILSSAFLVIVSLGSIVYASPGFKLMNIAGYNFFTFFQDNSANTGLDASYFHSRVNDSYLPSPANNFNYIRGKTFLGNDTVVVDGSGNVGIGMTSPGTKLEVAGQVKITGGSPGAGKVLTSDAAGLATWTIPASGVTGGGQANYIARFLSATTVGTGVLYDNGTNVGIGTASPLSKLHISSAAQSTFMMSDTRTSGNQNGKLIYDGGTSVPGGGWVFQKSTDAGAFIANLMTIVQNTGNVGIGTISPGAKLTVSDNSGGVTNPLINVINTNSSGRAFLQVSSDSVAAIGLVANGSTNAIDPNYTYLWAAGSSQGLGIHNDSPNRTRFLNGGTERLSILNNGYVGIGTTTPGVKLHISDPSASVVARIESVAASTSAQLNINSSAAGYPHILFTQAGTGRFEIGQVANNGNFYFNNNVQSGEANSAMVISKAGKVGIGTTTPSTNLHIKDISGLGANMILESAGIGGSIGFNDGGVQKGRIEYGFVGNYLKFLVNGNTAMHIDSAGNVGIGTSAPGAKLDVVGQVTATQFNGPLNGNAATASAVPWSGITGKPIYNDKFQAGNWGQHDSHGAYTDFNGINQWGGTFIQGNTNGPSWDGASQHYQQYQALGSNYDTTTYGMQTTIPRNTTTPYFSVRFKEASVWGAWQKISAGYADSAPWTGITGKPTNISTWTNDSGYLAAGFASTSGQPASTALANETGNGAFQAMSQGNGVTAGAAFMSFHRPNAFAAYLGLDTDGVFKVGGWSMTNVSYPLILGNGYSNATSINLTGNMTALGFFYPSDRQFKENILPLNNSLVKILNLNGYSFDWKKDGRKDIGVIAQEVEKQFPDIVHTDEKTGLKSVEYGNLVAPIIEAIKELSLKGENTVKSIADQQKIIDAQNEKIQSLESRLEKLESIQLK